MTALKYTNIRTLLCPVLLLIFINFTPFVGNTQENPGVLKKYEFNDTISNLLLKEIGRLNKRTSKGDYIVINYNKSKNQIKMVVLDKYDFSGMLISFEEKIIGLAQTNEKTFAFVGDSRMFLKDLCQFEKMDEYKSYYRNVNRKRVETAKTQGFVNFPTAQDPYSLFYNFDGKHLIYLKSELILVVDDNWL